jgi:hypothetical protein
MSKKKDEFSNDAEVISSESPKDPGTFQEKVEDSTVHAEKPKPHGQVTGDFNPKAKDAQKPKSNNQVEANQVAPTTVKASNLEKSAVEDIGGTFMVSLTKHGRLIRRGDMSVPQLVKELKKDVELSALIKGQRIVKLLGDSYPGFKSRIRSN